MAESAKKIEIWAIERVKPYERNPRLNERAVTAVANSIRDFGFQQPIIIDPDGVIICGHTRLKAAQRLNLTEVPVIISRDLTEEQKRAFRLADNRVGELSEWDVEKLKQEIMGLGDSVQVEAYGFNLEDLRDESEDTVVPDGIVAGARKEEKIIKCPRCGREFRV